jgi:hypothetical protein
MKQFAMGQWPLELSVCGMFSKLPLDNVAMLFFVQKNNKNIYNKK